MVQEQETESAPTRTFSQGSLNLESSNLKVESKQESNLASFEMLPKCNRVNYRLTPSLIEMARMTEKQLSQISNLSIENNNGKITWEGYTDVRGINFDELVSIELFAAEVYPEEIELKGLKPAVGQGINKPAIIELYNLKPPKKVTDAKKQRFIEGLKQKTATMEDTHFISYDEDTATLKFKVEHFTKYAFSGIDADEDQSEAAEESSESEEQNAQIKSIQKSQEDQPRFSFGGNQPVRNDMKRSSYEVPDEDEESDQMEVDTHQKQPVGKIGYLEKINEESESRVSSMIEDDEYGSGYHKKSHKIQFYERQEKEFEEDEYEELEDAEDEFDDQQSETSPKTLDQKRAEIENTEKVMKQMLGDIYHKTSHKQKETNLNRISKYSGPCNKILGHFNTYVGYDIPQNTTDVKHLLVPFSIERYENRKDDNPEIVQRSENEIVELYIASLSPHLNASSITPINITKNEKEISQLPYIKLPESETELTRMWFSILSALKHLQTSENHEIRKVIEKECEIMALLNACFGNSFIDLSHYMNNPERVNSKLIDKYKDEVDEDKERRRNQIISNWVKYTTRNEINERI